MNRSISLYQQGDLRTRRFSYRWLASPAIDKFGKHRESAIPFGGSPNFAGQRFAGPAGPGDAIRQASDLRSRVLSSRGAAADGGLGVGRALNPARWEDYSQTGRRSLADDCTILVCVGRLRQEKAATPPTRAGSAHFAMPRMLRPTPRGGRRQPLRCGRFLFLSPVYCRVLS